MKLTDILEGGKHWTGASNREGPEQLAPKFIEKWRKVVHPLAESLLQTLLDMSDGEIETDYSWDLDDYWYAFGVEEDFPGIPKKVIKEIKNWCLAEVQDPTFPELDEVIEDLYSIFGIPHEDEAARARFDRTLDKMRVDDDDDPKPPSHLRVVK